MEIGSLVFVNDKFYKITHFEKRGDKFIIAGITPCGKFKFEIIQ